MKQHKKICSPNPLPMLFRKANETLEETLSNSEIVAMGMNIVEQGTNFLRKAFRELPETELVDFVDYEISLLGKKREEAIQKDSLENSTVSNIKTLSIHQLTKGNCDLT